MNAPHTELAVADVSRLVERLGADTHPLQQYRELTTNAIEAVAEVGAPGTITWDVDWEHLHDHGTRKLCITDTGLGMTAQQMRDLINHLAASGAYKARGNNANFGVGAKIAAGMRNPAGLQYASWPAGGTRGARVRFGRSPDGRWGLLPLAAGPDGWFEALGQHPAGAHGTTVTLMGDTGRVDTTRAPDGVDGRDWWLLRYLNSRYIELPDGLELLVRPVCRTTRVEDARTPQLERVRGMRDLLGANATAAGRVRLDATIDARTPAATVHWWILTDDAAGRRRQAHTWPSSGHTAAILDGETYEVLPSTRGGYQRLQEFGVRFGYERVVVYVEPDRDDRRIVSNTARTRLLCSGEDLPWATWASAFRDALPQALIDLQEYSAARHAPSSHRETIARRMSAHAGVYDLPSYRAPARPRAPRADGLDHSTTSTTRTSLNGTTPGPASPIVEAPPGAAWERLPTCRWVSTADGTRAAGELEDRAGRYEPDTDTLTINADYRPITALIAHFAGLHGDAPGNRLVIESAVREWCETSLCEAVIRYHALKASPAWSDQDAARLIDDIGLSAALAPVAALTHHIARALAQRLGKAEQREPPASAPLRV